MGSISIREYIRWLPDPPAENTSTLVLTSPGRRFVDIRMLKTGDNEIEWAFAGSSSSLATREDGTRRSVWRHAVDSRTRDAESVADEADMLPVAGRSGYVSERGRMVNPDTGREAGYEEMWRDVEPEAVPPAGSGEAEGSVRCLVLELDDRAAEQRGLVVCLGRHCQGVARRGADFALEQWRWEGGSWARRRRVGPADLYVPCRDAVEGVDLKVGGRVERDGLVWTVVEASET